MADARYERARLLFAQERYADALSVYRAIADDHPTDANVCEFIGRMYVNGLGTRVDCSEAILWYQRAADLGSPSACVFLAGVYFKQGRRDEARDLLERAARTGYAPALYYLGRTYEVGNGVPIDLERAYQYFAQAAEKGHVFAQRQIAVAKIRGDDGVRERFIGAWMFIKTLVAAVKIHMRDPTDERIVV